MKWICYLSLLLLLSSCWRPVQPDYTEYRPVLLSRESLEKSIVFHAPEKIISPAKIHYKDNYIFISEHFKGVHIIDNTDPKNPVNKGYIAVPGCVDMAVKGNTMYVNNAVDLVAVNLNSLASLKVEITKRSRDAFPELATPDGKPLPDKYKVENRPENVVIVAWKK